MTFISSVKIVPLDDIHSEGEWVPVVPPVELKDGMSFNGVDIPDRYVAIDYDTVKTNE